MRILIDTSNVPMPTKLQAELARGCVRGVVAVNRVLLRLAKQAGKPYPPLYKSGVEYRPEPWTGLVVLESNGDEWKLPSVDEFANVRTVYARGWGDCDDLCCWRLAELHEAGELGAEPRVYWRHFLLNPRTGERKRIGAREAEELRRRGAKNLVTIMHCEVRRAPVAGETKGRIEDPSRYLGL